MSALRKTAVSSACRQISTFFLNSKCHGNDFCGTTAEIDLCIGGKSIVYLNFLPSVMQVTFFIATIACMLPYKGNFVNKKLWFIKLNVF